MKLFLSMRGLMEMECRSVFPVVFKKIFFYIITHITSIFWQNTNSGDKWLIE